MPSPKKPKAPSRSATSRAGVAAAAPARSGGSTAKNPPPAGAHPQKACVTLPGSERSRFGDAPQGGPSARQASSRRITISVLVRRRTAMPAVHDGTASVRVTRAKFRQQFGADPAAVKAVRTFAQKAGLTFAATPDQLAARTVQLTGTRAQLQQAFGVSLTDCEHAGATYRVREGGIQIPEALAGQVEAVLGLDNRPQAQAHFRIARGAAPGRGKAIPAAAGTSGFTPPQIAGFYDFPANASAAGQTIGLIELGGGYRAADLKAYFSSLGLPNPSVTAVSVDGGKNAPSTADGADGEVMLDIEVAAAVAPGAAIAVYFAPNTDQGFIDAITTAVHDTTHKPSVISISWGGPESSWTGQAVTALDSACQAAALLGVTITVACGDNGSTDGVSDGASHVDFPASSPHVLACGGTKITVSGDSLTGEVVWNELGSQEGATGGGVSSLFAKPSWQANANVPAAPSGSAGGRGVPDVAGDADPVTGYTVRVDGQTLPIGGTSAVAPLWAGLVALSNAAAKTSAGLANPALYNAPSAFRDITQGSNGAFSAGPGWDPCTGLGSPKGTAIIAALGSSGSGGTATGSGTGSGKGKGSGRKHHKPKHKESSTSLS